MKWNETNGTINTQVVYNIYGLNLSYNYSVINTTSFGSSIAYASLIPDTNGEINFTIWLNGNTEILLKDGNAPILTLQSPLNTTYNTITLWLNYTASDTNLNTTWYSYNGTNTTLSGNTTYTALNNQQSTIYIYANDSAGNINSTSVTFTVDATPPTYTNLALNSTAPKHNESVKFSALWNDSFSSLAYYFLSWNDTGTWANDSVAAFSENWSNITKQVTANKSQSVSYIIYANDTFGNLNATTQGSFTVNNSLPTLTVTIVPSPAQVTNNLNCTYTYSDMDNDVLSVVWFRWYINNVLNKTTTQNLSGGNFSLNDNIICSAIAYDGEANSTWVNSSIVTIGDVTAPTLVNDSLSSSSGTVNTAFTIYINTTEANTISYIYTEITDPNALKTNFSMAVLTSSGSEYRYYKSYTPSIVGVYSFKFYARDESGNARNLTSALSYSSTSVPITPPPSGGNGGGGGEQEESGTFILYKYGTKATSLPLSIISCGLPSQETTYRIAIENKGTTQFTPKFSTSKGLTNVVKIIYSGLAIPKSGASDFTISIRIPDTAKIGDKYNGTIYTQSGTFVIPIDAEWTVSKICIGGEANFAIDTFKAGFFRQIIELPSSKEGIGSVGIYWGYAAIILTLFFLKSNPDKIFGAILLFGILIFAATII